MAFLSCRQIPAILLGIFQSTPAFNFFVTNGAPTNRDYGSGITSTGGP
jgi:hypothetical protein